MIISIKFIKLNFKYRLIIKYKNTFNKKFLYKVLLLKKKKFKWVLFVVVKKKNKNLVNNNNNNNK